jgi:cytochrome P450
MVGSRAPRLMRADPMEVRGWDDDIGDAVSRASSGRVLAAERPAAVDRLAAYVEGAVADGSGLVGAACGVLAVDEVVSNAAVMLFGGIETVEGTIASAFAALLSTGGGWQALRDHPERIPNAVEESLRLHPAVMQVDRFATRQIEVGGATIDPGDFVVLSIAGANRDPDVYDDPDIFDILRANARTHLTFAQGPHVCVGLHLARLEVAAAIEACLSLPGFHLTAPVEFHGSVFRKPRRVDVAWHA